MGDIEQGSCDICGTEEVQVNRKYYHYDIPCDCCNKKEDDHFEIVYYCNGCDPAPPEKVIVSLKPKD